MFLLLLPLYVTFCTSETQDPAAQCDLVMKNYTFEYKYSQEGDIILGGIFTVHTLVELLKAGKFAYHGICGYPHQREYLHLAAFLNVIEEINNRSDLLPNITLGYHTYDSCRYENKAIKDVLQILSGHTVTAPNYSCMENDAVVGFIGDLQSSTTLPMAQLLTLYGYTQISYGARDPHLSDKRLYPNFFRTVPDDKIQFSAFVKLLERFQWNWVGIITSDDESGRQELQQIIRQFTSHQICVEFTILVSKTNYNNVPKVLQKSSTDVIIICGTYSMVYMMFLYNVAHVLKNKTLILPSSWSRGDTSSLHPCVDVKEIETHLHFPDDPTSYQVYTAVYIMAQALHDINMFFINGKQNPLQISYYKRRGTYCFFGSQWTVPWSWI
ncbi:vomeronasal type-2 receptor 1-like [Leptodactylus fuscus]